jgi:predicted Zn finger-like uncharacterized protein
MPTSFLTRCPICFTTFRMTQEQLMFRDGNVRCGSCHHIFNAMEHLLEETSLRKAVPATHYPGIPHPDKKTDASETSPFPSIVLPADLEDFPETGVMTVGNSESAPEPAPDSEPAQEPVPEAATARFFEATHPVVPHDDEPHPTLDAGTHPPIPPTRIPVEPEPLLPTIPETPPLSASRDAGSYAHNPPEKPWNSMSAAPEAAETQDSPERARQQEPEAERLAPESIGEIPGHSRWSVSPLEDLGTGAMPRATWPFILTALFLSLVLALQAGLHFRAELSRKMPSFALFFKRLNINVPLPREVDRISIEDSDLQSENQPGRLRLAVTFRNSAPYTQAWPHLELTLTDVYNARLTRKVFAPEDYLPADASAAFTSGDTQVILLLNAGDMPVTGYSLYLFYP